MKLFRKREKKTAVNRALFNISQTKDGEIFLNWLEERYLLRPVAQITESQVDPALTQFNAGEQSTALTIRGMTERGKPST